MQTFSVSPTSNRSATCQEVVLRSTTTTRISFLPQIVENPSDPEASVRGKLVVQRKHPSGDWPEHKDLDLSKLRAGERIEIEIKSGEVLTWFNQIGILYSAFQQGGIPKATTLYRTPDGHEEGVRSTLRELRRLGDNGVLEAAIQVIDWIMQTNDLALIHDELGRLDTRRLQQLNSALGLATLKGSLKIWEDNQQNGSENFWHQQLIKNPFVLSQLFPYPVVIAQQKAYMGGKLVDNTGGNVLDFLAQNNLTNNAVLIEIKTPTTDLLGASYRPDVISPSRELTGAVQQVLNDKHHFATEYPRIARGQPFGCFDPPCVVLAGNGQKELTGEHQRRAFELYRRDSRNVQIVTYDEIFGKIRMLVDLLERNEQPLKLAA